MSLGSAQDPSHFNFFLSCDLIASVAVRIQKLSGVIPAYSAIDTSAESSIGPSSLYVSVTLCDEFGALGPPSPTPFTEAALSGAGWEHDIVFDVKYRDLMMSAQLALTIWEDREDADGPSVLGGTTLPLFSKKGRLKSGTQILHVWASREADETVPSSTPGKLSPEEHGVARRVQKVMKRMKRGEVMPVPWLDNLSMAAGQVVLDEEARQFSSKGLRLVIDLPSFALPVMYHDVVLSSAALAVASSGMVGSLESFSLQGPAAAAAVQENTLGAMSTPLFHSAQRERKSHERDAGERGSSKHSDTTSGLGELWLDGPLTILDDPEIGRETPAEAKAQKLARSSGRTLLDAGLRPNTSEKEQIDAALALPPGQPLSRKEQELIWRFRFVLVNDPRAITKFFKSVDWSDASETSQAIDLMRTWAPISVAEALELLSPEYTVDAVRSHAVTALQNTSDEELLQYLLQLVQALRYERKDISALACFLVARATHAMSLATGLFWYLCAELDDSSFGERAKMVQTMLIAPETLSKREEMNEAALRLHREVRESEGNAAAQECIPLQLNLVARLRHLSEEMKKPREGERRTSLLPTSRTAASMTEKLREVLAPGKSCSDLTSFECPCPLDPSVTLCGILPQHCKVFASKENPIKIAFKVKTVPGGGSPRETDLIEDIPPASGAEQISREFNIESLREQHESPVDAGEGDGGEGLQSATYACAPCHNTGDEGDDGHEARPQGHSRTIALMYKYGDDLRQDQLVLQLISLMDRLLKREHLDLCMVPYAVLPTSSNDGLMEFVPSSATVTSVINQSGSVLAFLRAHFPDPRSLSGVEPRVIENFIRSCAGCMVVGHVLGIGDRHLDNFMLTTDGKLFHIDFGFAFGRDPKFGNNPPLGLRPVLVDGMGGSDSQGYRRFVTLCGEAYNILRKSARLLLSLVHLMSGSSIKDIRSDPERAVLKVQERLRLDLSDHEAALLLEDVLASSLAAWMPRIAEVQHRMAQAFR